MTLSSASAKPVSSAPERGYRHAETELHPGLDFRKPQYRREVFLRFYEFHLRYRAHPGGVYYLMPALREMCGWTAEEALWYAFINGNTQNPVTSLLIHRRFPHPNALTGLGVWFNDNYARLPFDTDRRHHKPAFLRAVEGYTSAVWGWTQAHYWEKQAEDGFRGVWAAATSIPSFGRLSSFSYAEYLRIMGVPFDCDNLFLEDVSGSRSHRNGLCKVLGRDDLDWHASNPGFDGNYTGLFDWLGEEAAILLAEARARVTGGAAADVSYFTLESALCTYKSWHRPNRRYANVYNDMLYDRIRHVQELWPDEDLSPFWAARAAALPQHLRLEDMPCDPGCVPRKQNHYRLTGQVIMMHRDWPEFRNDLNRAIESETLPRRKT
jgi:Alpha-glutamyl/putrescinyl thymine pyrophosphorylase clade 2